MDKHNTKYGEELDSLPTDMTSDLTPISLKEAKRVLGKESLGYSDESLLTAILDFTAIARAFLRKVPNYNEIDYNISKKRVLI